MIYTKKISQIVRTVMGRFIKFVTHIDAKPLEVPNESNLTTAVSSPPPVSRKYSDLMKWQDQMLKEVGLNIPTKWEETIKSTPSKTEEFTVTFIRRKPQKKD
jgi:hypothetical protein